MDEVGSIPTSVLNFAQLYGVKGGEVEAFVKRTAEEVVANSFTEACVYTAGFAVFHSAQYFQIKCKHDEHHKERIEKMSRLAAAAEAEAKAAEEAAAAEDSAAEENRDIEAAPAKSTPKKAHRRRSSLGMSADVLDSPSLPTT